MNAERLEAVSSYAPEKEPDLQDPDEDLDPDLDEDDESDLAEALSHKPDLAYYFGTDLHKEPLEAASLKYELDDNRTMADLPPEERLNFCQDLTTAFNSVYPDGQAIPQYMTAWQPENLPLEECASYHDWAPYPVPQDETEFSAYCEDQLPIKRAYHLARSIMTPAVKKWTPNEFEDHPYSHPHYIYDGAVDRQLKAESAIAAGLLNNDPNLVDQALTQWAQTAQATSLIFENSRDLLQEPVEKLWTLPLSQKSELDNLWSKAELTLLHGCQNHFAAKLTAVATQPITGKSDLDPTASFQTEILTDSRSTTAALIAAIDPKDLSPTESITINYPTPSHGDLTAFASQELSSLRHPDLQAIAANFSWETYDGASPHNKAIAEGQALLDNNPELAAAFPENMTFEEILDTMQAKAILGDRRWFEQSLYPESPHDIPPTGSKALIAAINKAHAAQYDQNNYENSFIIQAKIARQLTKADSILAGAAP